MATHTYNFRSRLNSQSPSIRITPFSTPVPKSGPRSPRKAQFHAFSLELQHVIGTTATSPNSLSCCAATNTYVCCAGAIAVLTTVHDNGTQSQKHYRARPTTASINPPTAHYDLNSPSAIPSKRRTSFFGGRKHEEPQGQSLAREWSEDGTKHTWTARERIKSTSCVSLSAEGKWLAVGETGYNPRVLLFAVAADAPTEIPTSIVSDHTFGVRSVAFSPDSRYLASLGDLNDGFLFIWTLQARTGVLSLHSANKCTTNINDMVWCGHNLVTVGTRHVKVWQVGEATKPSAMRRLKLRSADEEKIGLRPATLQGRNCLLGGLADAVFSCATTVSDSMVILGTEPGQLCLIDLSLSSLELRILKIYDFGISSITFQPDGERIVFGGGHGLHVEEYSSLVRPAGEEPADQEVLPRPSTRNSRAPAVRVNSSRRMTEVTKMVAVGSLAAQVIAIDSEGNQFVEQVRSGFMNLRPTIASHKDPIQGVSLLPTGSPIGAFFTWTSIGDVKFWTQEGSLLDHKRVDLEQSEDENDTYQNELRIVRYISNSDAFVTGDRFGVLKVINHNDWRVQYLGRAHSAEILDIANHHDSHLLATSGRDRIVQLFDTTTGTVELVQTMDEHIGAVNRVAFCGDAHRLISCSADRTVIIRERLQRHFEDRTQTAYLSARVVTLRATPLSMTLTTDTAAALLVSTSDRHITKIDQTSGAVIETTKLVDPENDDTVTLNSILLNQQKPTNLSNTTSKLLVAFSSVDKSVRLYDAEKSCLLDRQSGHTEGISDICLIEHPSENGHDDLKTVVSTGLDGTIMMWRLSASSSAFDPGSQDSPQLFSTIQTSVNGTPRKCSPVLLPPLRKVLTKVDILELTGGSGANSPPSTRSQSPARLVRRRSQLAMSATINEQDESKSTPQSASIDIGGRHVRGGLRIDYSPPLLTPSITPVLKKQRSRSTSETEPSGRKNRLQRSPSPPAVVSTPDSPNRRQRANNKRLRRPPSVPTDLRNHTTAQSRRQSVSQANDFGSVRMATEQATRMLRTYRKKLVSSKEELVYDDLEEELEALLNLIEEKRDKNAHNRIVRRAKNDTAKENDINDLTVLLNRTNIANRPPVSIDVEN